MTGPETDDDTVMALLIAALDTAKADPERLRLMTAWCLLALDQDRDAALDRLRHEGVPRNIPKL